MSAWKVLSYVILMLSAPTPLDSIPALADLDTLEMGTHVLVGHMTACSMALFDHVTPIGRSHDCIVGHVTARSIIFLATCTHSSSCPRGSAHS